jgi:hypothetical protein
MKIDEISLSEKDMDKMVLIMSECGVKTHKIQWGELIKIATAMELYRLKAKEL